MRRGSILLAAAALLLSACSDDGNTVSGQARDGSQKGYVSGDGTVEQLAPEDRTRVIELNGQAIVGAGSAGGEVELEPWSSQAALGDVLVINVWGSWCGPCVEEVPDLKAAHAHFQESGDPVQFIGVNDRDSASAALAFEQRHDMPYQSLVDDGGKTLLQLQGMANPRPTTLVLDQEGRLAARVAGQVDDATLQGLVEDVLEQ
ncbi:TlpA family protein disulfide reductase [Ornithinimicrobium ciconiae]|uniref:TlpA family protein disulfide reductase n=1 Tax=Ornithinimicrobium ciconiae TaxID=2594265 RepID=A0A516GE92_9MICO|nr:TlpA disulfide reductase family protein [Ornithinimicrobium ciconiae]QDO89853.1 TlpA family protein disulfide reductase [Ornithinimicrobium ciconiae]